MSNRLFRIDREAKDVSEVKPTSFAKEGFLETKDIHEWLISHPGLLGEDLLVIQREHVGVVGSHRRPDILAIDTEGNLVIVEVKRDDSGTDVYWQAEMYAATYWPRSGEDLINLYAEYKKLERREATERLLGHTGLVDEQDLRNKLNKSQRIVLVAGSFPKEVTTTVLWLNDQGLDVSCLQLTPFADAATGAYYIQSSSLIPVPETKELMVELRETTQEQLEEQEVVESRKDDQVSEFMRLVMSKAASRLTSDLRPTKWSKWAGAWGTTRYFKWWYDDEWPWYNHRLCFSADLETAAGAPDYQRVYVYFEVYITYLKSEGGVSEEMLESIKGFASSLDGEEGFKFDEKKATF